MNFLVTINIGNYLCDNARNSMISACQRWKCDFFEVTENKVGDQNICFNKLVAIKELCKEKEVDSVFYVDADCLIRSDAPSPFKIFNSERIYAVRDVIDGWPPHRLFQFRSEVSDPWLQKVHEMLKWDIDIEEAIKEVPRWFFNAGVFLINNPKEVREIDYFIENIPISPVNGRIEQAMWNYILKDKVSFMPYEWNAIDPVVEFGDMIGYIYHFTGIRWETLRRYLPIYRWNYDTKQVVL